MFFVNGVFMIIGAGGVPFPRTIQITQEAWDKANPDVQEGVEKILTMDPIPLLSSSQRGDGIKIESGGLEFHTQSKKRVQAPFAVPNTETWTFDRYGTGWGH